MAKQIMCAIPRKACMLVRTFYQCYPGPDHHCKPLKRLTLLSLPVSAPQNWGHTMDYAERAKVVLPAPNPLSRGSQSTHSPTAVSPSGISGAIGGQPWASGTERRSMPCRSTDRMTANMRSSAPVGLGRPGTGAAARMVSPFHNGPLRLSRSIGGSGRRAAGQGQDDPHDPEVRLLGPGPVAEGIELEPLESHFKVQVSHGGARAEPGSAQEAFLSRRTTGNSPQSSRDHSLQGTGPGAERASPPPGLRNLNSRAMQLHAMPTIGSAGESWGRGWVDQGDAFFSGCVLVHWWINVQGPVICTRLVTFTSSFALPMHCSSVPAPPAQQQQWQQQQCCCRHIRPEHRVPAAGPAGGHPWAKPQANHPQPQHEPGRGQ